MLKIRLQRNLLGILAALLLFSNIWMAVALNSQERLLVMVPTVDRELIVGTNYVSDDYLLLRGEQIIQLLFSIRHENYSYNIDQILKQVDSKAKPEFYEQLNSFVSDIKSKKYFYTFGKEAYEIDPNNLTVMLSGYLDTYLNDKRILSNFKSYRLSFVNNSGLVKLISFEEVRDEKI